MWMCESFVYWWNLSQMGNARERTSGQSATDESRSGSGKLGVSNNENEHERRRTCQTLDDMRTWNWLGEREDCGTRSRMDSKKIPWGDRIPSREKQGNNPTEQFQPTRTMAEHIVSILWKELGYFCMCHLRVSCTDLACTNTSSATLFSDIFVSVQNDNSL